MVLTPWVPAMVLVMLSFLLIGAGPVLWVISSTTLRQVVTPAAMLGRVSALITTATVGARQLGSAIAALAAAYGPNACIFLAAGFVLQLTIIASSATAKLVGSAAGNDASQLTRQIRSQVGSPVMAKIERP